MKEMVLTFYQQTHIRTDWQIDMQGERVQSFLQGLVDELSRFAITLKWLNSDAYTIEINSYADLLNAVRISSPSDSITNTCIGHIIGKSEHLDLCEDIRRAVMRIAFAPEMVPPDAHARKVCHNCGCGC